MPPKSCRKIQSYKKSRRDSQKGSFSLKLVAPVLSPDVDYNDLDAISGGFQESAIFWSLAAGVVKDPDEVEHLRLKLLQYCKLDTEALMKVHLKLRSLA